MSACGCTVEQVGCDCSGHNEICVYTALGVYRAQVSVGASGYMQGLCMCAQCHAYVWCTQAIAPP